VGADVVCADPVGGRDLLAEADGRADTDGEATGDPDGPADGRADPEPAPPGDSEPSGEAIRSADVEPGSPECRCPVSANPAPTATRSTTAARTPRQWLRAMSANLVGSGDVASVVSGRLAGTAGRVAIARTALLIMG
jgi:hypothetical protein